MGAPLKLCRKCNERPRRYTSGDYCQPCAVEAVRRRKSSLCARCGEYARMPSKSWCSRCANQVTRESLPNCHKCNVNPAEWTSAGNSITYCKPCQEVTRLNALGLCLTCKIRKRLWGNVVCRACRNAKMWERRGVLPSPPPFPPLNDLSPPVSPLARLANGKLGGGSPFVKVESGNEVRFIPREDAIRITFTTFDRNLLCSKSYHLNDEVNSLVADAGQRGELWGECVCVVFESSGGVS